MAVTRRKGQFMAVEAVLTLGLSLVVAVAAIGIFNSYRQSVMDKIHQRHASVVTSEVVTGVYNLRQADSGSTVSVDIPENPEGEYTVAFEGDNLVVSTGGTEFSQEINGVRWVDEFEGSASSTRLKILKSGDDILMRPS